MLFAVALTLFLFSCGDTSVNINNGHDDGGGSGGGGGGGDITPPSQIANAIVITLTSWQTTRTGTVNPRISFGVLTFRNGRGSTVENTGTLLSERDMRSWTGSRRSSPVSFDSQADKLEIWPYVYHVGALWDTDISPGYYISLDLPVYAGRSGNATFNYGAGDSRVSISYEFVRR